MTSSRQLGRKRGYTLIEVLLASALSTLVLASALGLFLSYQWAHHDLALCVEAQRKATMALSRMVYGVGGTNRGLRTAGNIQVVAGGDGWTLQTEDDEGMAGGTYEYRASQQALFYLPAGGTEVQFADSIAQADAAIVSNALSLNIRVDLQQGRLSTTQALNTVIRWRN